MRGHFTTLQVLQILLAIANGLWALFASLFFTLFLTAGMSNPKFPGLSPQEYRLMLFYYGAWAIFAWLSCLGNFACGIGLGGGRWRMLALMTAVLNLVPGISFLWLSGIPVGIYGLWMTLNKRSVAIFRRVARGGDFRDALEDDADAHAGRRGRRARKDAMDDDDGPPRRNDPPRESW